LNDAEKLLRAELAPGRTVDQDDIETFKATNILARILARTGGSPEEALKLLEDALPRERRAFGPEHEVTIESTFELAITYDALGRGKEAETLYSDVVAARRRVLGPEHPVTLFSMYVQAERLAGDHRYLEAERVYGEVLETQKRILGAEHQDTLHTMVGLGATYFSQHRYTDADRVYDEALSVASRVPNNSVMAMLFYNRACWAAIQSKRQESLANLEQAVDHGFQRADEMAADDDLKSLHGDPRFNAILANVKRLAAAK
jgi:tetratricopeptide (TPR) repeat protein